MRHALDRLPEAPRIKLYNSGNFFDPRALPRDDYPEVARLCDDFRRVIVENHPKLCGDDVFRFRDLIQGRLEIAMGLETIHPQALAMLNKQMTVADFETAAQRMRREGVDLRVFLLLGPPGVVAAESVAWTIRSAEFAFQCGALHCAVIPTRAGNGAMDALQRRGAFQSQDFANWSGVRNDCSRFPIAGSQRWISGTPIGLRLVRIAGMRASSGCEP